jgi:hypothetical protein
LRDQSRFASRHPHLSVVQIFKDQRRTAQKQRQQQRGEIIQYLQKTVKKKNDSMRMFVLTLQVSDAATPQKRGALYRSDATGQYDCKKYSPA